MTRSFVTPIEAMDDKQKEWFATAMVCMVLADGNISEGEVQGLMSSLSFIRDQEFVDRLKKFIQHQTPPTMPTFVGWNKNPKYRAAMLLDLMQVAISDRDLSGKEKEQFHTLGKLLGFSQQKIDELVQFGTKTMENMAESE